MVLHQNDALIVDDSLLCGLRPMTQTVYRRSLEGARELCAVAWGIPAHVP